jgi:Methyltransferase domain
MPAAPSGPWFNAVARYLGPAYLRNAFTKGTEQEVAFLVDALELDRGERVLDVGCGPGRHALALARGGIDVVGVDLSEDFITLARDAAEADVLPARFEVGDVASLRTTASSTPSSASAREDSGSSVAATNPGPSSASPPHSVPVAGSRSPRFQPPSPSASSRRGRASTPPPVCSTSGPPSATRTAKRNPSTSGRRASRRASSSCSPGARGSRSSACTASHPDGTKPRGRRSTTPNCCSWLGGTPDRGLPW